MLGPTLFLIYINEVTKVVTCEVSLYADDTLLYSEVNNDGDRLRFQANINSLNAWSSEWKMLFNTDKCVVITFSKGPTAAPQYSLECVHQTAYLGIEIRSNLKFDKRITSKIKSASKFLGCIKYSLHEASERGKLLAYTSLCRPILEYGDMLWDPSNNTTSGAIEHVQSQAMRFIKNIKGRRGVTEGRALLKLEPEKAKRKVHTLSSLMRIPSDKTRHQTLASAMMSWLTVEARQL